MALRLLRVLAVFWVVLFWTACVAIPIFTLMNRAGGDLPLLDPSIIRIAGVTLTQALTSTVISAVIGLPLGIWLGSRSGKSGLWSDFFLSIPFGVPTVVAGLAWVMLLGRSGIFTRWGFHLDWAYSMKAVILAHVVFNIPWIALWVAQSRAFLPQERLEAAKTLGAGQGSIFRAVIWPQVKWAFLSASCQSWVFCALSFALVLVLGGGPPVQTLEVALYSRVRYGNLDLPGAIACAIWELGVTMLPWLLVVVFQAFEERDKKGDTHSRFSGRKTAGFLGGFVAALFVLPYFAVFLNAWGLNGHSLSQIFSALWVSALLAISTATGSLLTAIAAVIAVGVIPEKRRFARAIAFFLVGIPSGISALVLGLGLWLSYRRWIDPFSGSPAAIVALQVALFSPIAFRIFWPVARARAEGLLEAAATLGASPSYAFFVVEWPRWKRPILSALGMVAAASLGEVAAVSLFYSEHLIPLPLLVSRWMGQYRFVEAQSVASLLLVLCVGILFFVFLTGKRNRLGAARVREGDLRV